MDPITTAIIAALSAGATGGIKDAAQKGIVDSYNWIKNTIKKKFRHNGELIEALEKIEEKPDAKERQELLSEEIVAAGVNKDTELLRNATELMDMLSKKQISVAKFSTQAENIQGIVQADEIKDLTQNFGDFKK